MKNAPLIICRGAPGSGKSTFSLKLQIALRGLHFETDSFFEDALDGSYHFDPSLLGVAHAWNQGNVIRALRDFEVPVIVSNTFSYESEITTYIDIAKRFNRPVYIFTLLAQHENVHGVPDNVVAKYRARVKPLSAFNGSVRGVYNFATDAEADNFIKTSEEFFHVV